MVKKRERAPTVPLTDALVSEVHERVRAERFIPTKQLVTGALARGDLLLLIEKLAVRGLERTTKGVRWPLAEQILASLEGSTTLAALAKRVSGASAAEVKRAALGLVEARKLTLVAGGRGDEVALPGSHLLAPGELDALRDLAKALAKVVARTRARKGAPHRTLSRREVSALFEPFVSPAAPAAPAAGVAPGQVLEALAALERTRGRSVFVPDLVRSLGVEGAPAPAHRALIALAHAGKVELRPESGVGNLAPADRALCPSDAQGTLISYARVIAGGSA